MHRDTCLSPAAPGCSTCDLTARDIPLCAVDAAFSTSAAAAKVARARDVVVAVRPRIHFIGCGWCRNLESAERRTVRRRRVLSLWKQKTEVYGQETHSLVLEQGSSVKGSKFE